MSKLRVVHHLNQFFGRVGGEQADAYAFTVRERPIGPGLGLEKELAGVGMGPEC